MTPQQNKADELVWKFKPMFKPMCYCFLGSGMLSNTYDESVHTKNAIQCAIICVDEVLEATKIEVDRPDAGCYTVYSQYWQSVLNELKSRV